MQTFLPYPNFKESVKCLDYRRLGKQRVESGQIIAILEKLKKTPNQIIPWMNHPATLMWTNHLDALKCYYNYCLTEWVNRDYNNSMLMKHFDAGNKSFVISGGFLSKGTSSFVFDILDELYPLIEKPSFIGDQEFHLSHQSNLVRKLPEHYKPLFPTVPDNLPYIWPKGEQHV